MKASLIIFSVFIAGLLAGIMHVFPEKLYLSETSKYILYILMFLVGISIGSDKHLWQQFREMKFKILLVPLATIMGTGIGISVYMMIFSFPQKTDSLAISAGFGYYSLSSIMISKVSNETIGIIALLANIIREITTLILAPLLAKYFGKLAPIAAGGATTSDTTLPMIMKYSGKQYVLCAVLNGIILTLLVPILIAFIYSI
ncbi:MAG TPA: lysine exporter LysO family protein [Bacteroidales bacterium]